MFKKFLNKINNNNKYNNNKFIFNINNQFISKTLTQTKYILIIIIII